jgi:pimeloyl-ACP methyl ester carboxylesterase
MRRWPYIALGVLIVLAAAATQVPSIAAGALLHPSRRVVYGPLPDGCVDRTFPGVGVTLRGWHCSAASPRRGSLIYLHGIADNRASAAGIVPRFTKKGLDVIAYDSRGQGVSDGEACTYGYFEKQDVGRVIDGLAAGPVILIGTSLGAAVALQAAVGQPRIAGVVSAEVFSDLGTIARDRAPWLLPDWLLHGALHVAGQRGQFDIAKVSPVAAAAALRIPVLVIHGAEDVDTRPDHSRRVFAALAGPKRLLIIPGAHHNQSLSDAATWVEIDGWVDDVLRANGTRP